jgi:hypothetical protein
MAISEFEAFSKPPASIEIAIPEGVSARLALEWAVERLIRMIDALNEAEERERDGYTPPASCRLVVSASPAEIIRNAVDEELCNGL